MNKLFAECTMSIQFIFILTLLPIAYHDLRTRYIPDRYMLLSAAIAVLIRLRLASSEMMPLPEAFLRFTITAVVTALPFILLYCLRDDIGGADAKLAAITGGLAGVEEGLRILLMGCLLSLLVFAIHHFIILKKRTTGDPKSAYRYPLLPGICFMLSLATLSFPAFSY